MSIQAYKFETIVLGDGTVLIPQLSELIHREIEVLILVKPKSHKLNKSQATNSFLQKWTGFFANLNPEDEKMDYLIEKYK